MTFSEGATGSPRLVRRAFDVARSQEEIRDNQLTQERTEVLQMARAVALAGLPKKRSKSRDLVRTLRLGAEKWMRVVYSASYGSELPFGEDRFVLAAIQHLAVEAGSPVVFFHRVGQLLATFGLDPGGKSYLRLRQRFSRIAGLSITLVVGRSERELDDGSLGRNTFVISDYRLPTRTELWAESEGQLRLPELPPIDSAVPTAPYGVILDASFWSVLQDPSQRLLVPLNLLKMFVDRPIGWDYLTFLVHRCGAAKSVSVVDHEVLMGLFKDGAEPDRKAIFRLQRYHREIMQATDGHLNAELIQLGDFPSTGRGRKQKRWGLRVGPSRPLVWSGKRLAVNGGRPLTAVGKLPHP